MQTLPRSNPARRIALALGLLCALAGARAQNPFIEAAREAAPPDRPEPLAAAIVVRAFVEGCVAAEGDSSKVVDWALNAGYEPIDSQAGPGATLLSGQSGTVLAMRSDAGQLLVAVDLDRRCTVWAEPADGPAVRAELQRAMGQLASRGGARIQLALERTVDRAGTWRQQLQWRYRREGGTQDYAVGAVTTLTPQPTAQVLQFGPMPPARAEAAASAAAGPPPRR